MAYRHELSKQENAILRRIAWNVNKPMTETLGGILRTIAEQFPPGEVCRTCRDRSRCSDCFFNLEQSDNERSS